MMWIRRRAFALRLAVVFSLLSGLVVTAGCGDMNSYPATMNYPVRSDFIVVSLPKLTPAKFDNPGHMPLDFLASLPRKYDASKKFKVIDFSKIESMIKSGTLKLNDNEKAVLEESKNNNILDPRALTIAERTKIGEILDNVFGTPANPKIKKKTDSDPLGVAPEFVERLQLQEDQLKEGSRLYRQHCLHCHGLEGNGRGPTGPWVNPHPRDYRQAIFKFTSSTQDLGERKPRREDLMNVLIHGIDGTSMPSFALYDRKHLEQIISYIIHLSFRGEVEVHVMRYWIDDSRKLYDRPTAEEIEYVRASLQGSADSQIQIDEMTKITVPTEETIKAAMAGIEEKFNEALEGYAPRWIAAQDSAIQPDKYPYEDTEEALLASAARGANLFTLPGEASCVSCHKNYGRESPLSFDAWGTIVRPRDIVNGFYRGGRRPIDLYYRVWSGINGAGMASYDKTLRPTEEDKAKGIDKIWDLVNFMQVIHYPDLRMKLRAAPHNIMID